MDPPTERRDLPRITWCTTGPLSFLPLHAAGSYDPNKPQYRVYDYVVSSYTPTLTALLPSPLPPGRFRGILAVGQATTRGMSSLPGTVKELDTIQLQAGNLRFTRLEGAEATFASVRDGMHQHSWVHLACHASQNLDEPTTSAFYLHDKSLDLATISQNPIKDGGLAFLSACQTAAGVEKLSEEAVHLAAGMLMSGYASVIATMWSVGDADAPVVAEQVYARLFEGGKAVVTNAARALHAAVGHLRAKVGEDRYESWVPYIHVGQ
jgi:CHAT domain-containing protein